LGVVWVEVVEASLVAPANHVENGPGEVVKGLGLDFTGLDSFLEDGDEAFVTRAEDVVGLAAMLLFAADGDDEAIEVLLVHPEFETSGHDDGKFAAEAVGGGEPVGDKGVEFVDRLAEGGGVNVLFGAEVEVEGALGDFRGGGDVVDRGVGKTLLSKDFDGSGEDLPTAQIGEGLLTSLGGGHGIHASTGVGVRADLREGFSRKGRRGS